MLRQLLHSLEGKENRVPSSDTSPVDSNHPANSNADVVSPHARHISRIIQHTLLLFKLIIVLFFILTIIMYFFHLLFSDNPSRRDHLLNVATQLASAVALEQGDIVENKTEITPSL